MREKPQSPQEKELHDQQRPTWRKPAIMRIGLKITMFSEGSGADGGTHDYIDGLATEKPG